MERRLEEFFVVPSRQSIWTVRCNVLAICRVVFWCDATLWRLFTRSGGETWLRVTDGKVRENIDNCFVCLKTACSFQLNIYLQISHWLKLLLKVTVTVNFLQVFCCHFIFPQVSSKYFTKFLLLWFVPGNPNNLLNPSWLPKLIPKLGKSCKVSWNGHIKIFSGNKLSRMKEKAAVMFSLF